MMRAGDMFELAGYEVLATIDGDRNRFVVMSNNSSHVLVAAVPMDSGASSDDDCLTCRAKAGRAIEARFLASWQYSGPSATLTFASAYAAGLECASSWATAEVHRAA